MADNEIDVIFGANTTALKSGASDASSSVSSAASSMKISVKDMTSTVATESSKGGLAFKAISIAGHEAAHEIGLTGMAGRLAGHEVADLAMALGSGGMAFGLIAAAATVAYKIYEHFSKDTSDLTAELKKNTDSLYGEIKALDTMQISTVELHNAEQARLKDKQAAFLKKEPETIAAMKRGLDELTEAEKKAQSAVYDPEFGGSGGKIAWEAAAAERLDSLKTRITTLTHDIQAEEAKLQNAKGEGTSEIAPPSSFTIEGTGNLRTGGQGGFGDVASAATDAKVAMVEEANAIDMVNTKLDETSKSDAINKMAEDAKNLETTLSPIFGSFNSAIDSLIDGTKSVSEAFAEMEKSIIKDLVNIELKAMEAKIMESLVSGGGASGTATSSGSGIDMSVLSTVMAVGSGYAKSYDGGGEVSTGASGQLARLHNEEMVLNPELANKIRNMSDTGSGDVHIHVPVMTGADEVRNFFRNNSNHVMAAVQNSMRGNKG